MFHLIPGPNETGKLLTCFAFVFNFFPSIPRLPPTTEADQAGYISMAQESSWDPVGITLDIGEVGACCC